MKNIKIALAGLGYFGNFHLINLLNTPFTVVGIYDVDLERAKQMGQKYGVKVYDGLDNLIDDTDALDITAPTVFHFELIKKALEKGKHVFVEKPMTSTLAEAEEILALTKEKGLMLQVGHIERFNPVMSVLEGLGEEIIKIEANRMSIYNPRGTDVSVVFDLMIHDIDLVLSMVDDRIKDIRARGFRKYSDNLDYATAHIEFENGVAAQLNASILHPRTERTLNIWTKNYYIELDLAGKEAGIYKYLERPQSGNDIFEYKKNIKKGASNSILDELNQFYLSISGNKKPVVDVEAGYKAVMLAEKIENIITDENK